jgi:hypothetical protein
VDWKRYERAVVEKFFRDFPSPAFRVEPAGDDDFSFVGRYSGVLRQLDVAVFRRGQPRPFLVADAKRRSVKLDVIDVEAFLGLVEDVGAEIGALVASSGYSPASVARARGAQASIDLRVVTVEEATKQDWLAVGRRIYPGDLMFHSEIGRAFRMIEEGRSSEEIAEVLDGVFFEEWEALVGTALAEHPDEAQILLTWVSRFHLDDGWRFNAVRHLIDSDLMNEHLRVELLQRETDPEVLDLLSGG